MTKTPTVLVLAMLTMLPRLEAEQSIAAANRIAMGTGSLKKEAADTMARAWADAAAGVQHAAPAKPDPRVLISAGIKVRRVKRRKKTAPTP